MQYYAEMVAKYGTIHPEILVNPYALGKTSDYPSLDYVRSKTKSKVGFATCKKMRFDRKISSDKMLQTSAVHKKVPFALLLREKLVDSRAKS